MRTLYTALATMLVALLPIMGDAATEVESASMSPDIGVVLGSNAFTFEDADVAKDDLAGVVIVENLGARIDPLDVSGFAVLPDGDRIVCFDTIAPLVPSVFALPGDVARIDSGFYSIEFDAAANGVPDGVYCDAVTLDEEGNLILSFDVDVELPGGVFAADEDLVRVDGPSTFSIFFDGSAEGVPREFDVDGAHIIQQGIGALTLSFDTGGELGGITFADEDVLEYGPGPVSWSLSIDGSAQDPNWAAADADAVALPEPGSLGLLAAGGGLVCVLRSLRRRG